MSDFKPLSSWQLADNTTGEGGQGKGIGDDFRAKLKFNYTIKFEFRPDVAIQTHTGAVPMEAMEFGAKQVTLPNPIVSYAEVNIYNYRTKVATKVDYGQFNVSLYDDIHNNAHNIYKAYMEAISPIANVSGDQASSLMSISGNSSVGPLNNVHGVIKTMTLTHYSLNKITTYEYLNPKIVSVMLDELDMTTSDAATVSFTFNCDSVHTTEKTSPMWG